ncbi:MAG: ADP-ribosylglycohydrolase family protein [Oscillospiraceae bacterium]|nr:ADP-ribosylglycohydrolase family protein [Oscillospiraceae bacterium]
MSNKLLWKASPLIEWMQCKDEGRDVERLHALAKEIEEHEYTTDSSFGEAAAALVGELENALILPDFPYDEPNELEAIRAARPAKRHELPQMTLGEDDLLRRWRGAWEGRMAGCLLGKPVEGMRSPTLNKFLELTNNYPMNRFIRKSDFSEQVIAEINPWMDSCWGDNVANGFPVDDDLNYTVFAMDLIRRRGKAFTSEDVIGGWCGRIPAFATFTAERVAYRNYIAGVPVPACGSYYNPYREYIGAQIRVDYYGYIHPGNPEMAAEMAWRDARVSHVKNGIYGAMFIAALIAAAAVTDSPLAAIEAGLDEIPEKCRLRMYVDKVIALWKEGRPWEDAYHTVQQDFDEFTDYGWCHAAANCMIVAAALLWGGGDYGKSVCLAVQHAYDTDCNGATVGSIIGMMKGIDAVSEEWRTPCRGIINTIVYGKGRVTVDDMVKATLDAYRL